MGRRAGKKNGATAQAIKAMAKAGLGAVAIAASLGTSRQAIHQIAKANKIKLTSRP